MNLPAKGMTSLSALIVGLMVTSCDTTASGKRSVSTNAVYYVGTATYNAKIKNFRVQPADAQSLLTDFVRSHRTNSVSDAKVAIGKHSVIVGDAYHFYHPAKTGGIPLTGYYVDGNTGKVEFKKLEASVPYPSQK